MKIQTKNISKKISKQIGNYKFEVGILSDAPKKMPKKGVTKTYAGMTIAADGKASQKVKLAEVGKYTDNRFKWLKKPFKLKNNKDVLAVVNEIAAQVFGKKSLNNKRLENAVQAVVRNPILRGDYGRNAAATVKQKGFDKLGVWTGQMFKAIKAKRL